MRALLFALAALSFFAVFSAYYEDVSDSMEDLSLGYSGLDDATKPTQKSCVPLCTKKHFSSKQCRCACNAFSPAHPTRDGCYRAGHCLHIPKKIVDHQCKQLPQ